MPQQSIPVGVLTSDLEAAMTGEADQDKFRNKHCHTFNSTLHGLGRASEESQLMLF